MGSVIPFEYQGKAVPQARDFLNGAESNFGQSLCNNAHVSADQDEFPHAKSFASHARDSLTEIKSFSDFVSGLFKSSPGKNSEMDHSAPTITGKEYLTLLRPLLREYGHVVSTAADMEGPQQGLFSDFQWLAFACPMKRNTA